MFEWLKSIFHVHRWKEEKRTVVNLYDGENDKWPVSTKTLILYKCRICGEYKVETLQGDWPDFKDKIL